jgi:RNAse (barnase) inhibitor barstar
MNLTPQFDALSDVLTIQQRTPLIVDFVTSERQYRRAFGTPRADSTHGTP